MSKHPSDNTKRNLLRRSLAGILTLALLLGLLPSTIATAHAASWADPYVQTLADWGVMRGDVNGNMDPDRSITRAEFVTMMNRAYGYTKLGGHPFTDVRSVDWYSEDIDIAYNIGYFKGTADTLASPNDALTREQAAVLLARNMMLQPTVGETLGFTDTRTLSEWSRGLVGAAAANGIISGYEDSSFRPLNNITRGEVAAMLVRAIGTPVQTPGDHTLGNVYGNVTVNTSGVKLRDGVIVGNLYLTGGIDLGDVLLENITVLGEIVVSGGGESNSSQSSIIMRNVVADNLVVDSIGSQFVTLRAEGNTDIPTTVVRTSAFVDDSSLPGYGLSHITLDGDEGALYQLAGNIQEVLNRTPGSSLQMVQGSANKVTMDEYATGSTVLVDGDAQVGDLNLDVATTVEGTGDIKNLNVGAAGSTVEQLPDNIDIRPGITTDIAGSNMNSSQAAESSADPKLLAGYPAVRRIAPNSAELVFRTNKSGTIYWAVSAVADGSISESNLLEPPAYGGRILASGNLTANAANTDYTAAVTGLTSGGSYYVTAMLVDGRNQRSPIKVTAFTTPDDSQPAFADGYPVMTLVTTAEAQVTVMTTKSCLLYYALLPAGVRAPTEAEFRSAAIAGNLGYGSMSVTKNVTFPFPVNNGPLDEKTEYVLYLWLTDHDGAQSSAVVPLSFTTPDEMPPNVTDMRQTGESETSVQVTYTIDEPADLVYAIVTEGDHAAQRFIQWYDETFDPNDEDKSTLVFSSEAELLAAKVWLASGAGAAAAGGAAGTTTNNPLNITGLTGTTSSYVLYYMADDNATATGNLSNEIKALRVHTTDNTSPEASLRFTNADKTDVSEEPDSDAAVRIIFSENVKGGTLKGQNVFLNLYNDVLRYERVMIENGTSEDTASDDYKNYDSAKNKLSDTLRNYIVMYRGTYPTGTEVNVRSNKTGEQHENDTNWVVDWRNAEVSMLDDGTGRVQILLPTVTETVTNTDGTTTTRPTAASALNMGSGVSYYFRLSGITDLAVTNNPLKPQPESTNPQAPCYLQFKTSFAKVIVTETDPWGITSLPGVDSADISPKRIISFQAEPTTVDKVGPETYWDMLIWSNTTIDFTLYRRPINSDGTVGAWVQDGNQISFNVSGGDAFIFRSLNQMIRSVGSNGQPPYEQLNTMTDYEYAIYINKLQGNDKAETWNYPDLQVRISFMAGDRTKMSTYLTGGAQDRYERALSNDISSIEQPSPCYIKKPIEVNKAPEIEDGMPTITVTDTSAEINVSLDTDGYVYYLLLPMGQMSQGTDVLDNTVTSITEDEIKEITYFSMYYTPYKEGETSRLLPKDVTRVLASSTGDGITVSTPNVDNVIDGKLKDQFPQGSMPAEGDPAAPGESQITISIVDELTPNTIYYLFLVTRSDTAIYSDSPVCYRFTTSEPIRPTINVTPNGNNGVTVTVDKLTNLSYYLAPNGKEGGILPSLFSGYANNDWYGKTGGSDSWTGSTTTQIYTFTKDGSTYTFPYSRNGGDLTQMTNVDAMATPCYLGAIGQNYQGSVFDVFASPDSKTSCYAIITGSTTETGGIVANGTETCSPDRGTPITFNNLDPGSYTFVSVGLAPQGQGSGPAFRAYYSITVQTSNHPTVVDYTSLQWPAGTTTFSGETTLTFSDPLYFMEVGDNWQNLTKLCLCNSHSATPSTAEAACTTLSYAFNSTTAVQAKTTTTAHKTADECPQLITFTLNGLTTTRPTQVGFRRGLCSGGTQGPGHDDTLFLSFSIIRVVDDSADGYHYELSMTIPTTSSSWDGLPRAAT